MSQSCIDNLSPPLSVARKQPINLVKTRAHPPIKTILLVDDVDDCRLTTKWFLSSFGYAVDSVRSSEEALALFDSKIHDVVITDNSMPGMSGSEMAHIIKLRSPTTPVVMYSGTMPKDRTCVDVIILRPSHLLGLKDAIENALAQDKPPAPAP